jgi:hypothetical protein
MARIAAMYPVQKAGRGIREVTAPLGVGMVIALRLAIEALAAVGQAQMLAMSRQGLLAPWPLWATEPKQLVFIGRRRVQALLHAPKGGQHYGRVQVCRMRAR